MSKQAKQTTYAAAALSAFLAAGVVAPTATAAPVLESQQATAPSRMTVDVVGSSTGFTAPARHRPGAVTFRVRTDDPEGIRLGLLRLRDGVPVDRFLTHLTAALTERGEAAAAAGRQLTEEATMLGGALAVPGRTAEFRQRLGEGTYYLVDYQDADTGRPLTALVVDGPWAPPPPMVADAAITMVDTSAGPRFRVRRPLTADGTIAVTNRNGQLDEAVLCRSGRRPPRPTYRRSSRR
ncbi:hypothetical protein [Nocardioides speluncae]|uniref:hypothetical protein n=1 Tax=Nocardioides speluncae TaxID=2670337 RepID=UPI000D6923C4|nr:hypothetical protein [Nocardioides speluncae]